MEEMMDEWYEEEDQEIDPSVKFEQMQLLKSWREEFHAIYQIELNGMNFFFRQLTEPEFEQIEQIFEEIDEREEAICRLCVLDPVIEEEDWSNHIYGGYVEALSRKILEESYFVEGSAERFQAELDHNQAQMQTLQNQLPCIIKEVFPEYELKEIIGWGRSKQAYYYGRAVWMLENLRGISLRPVDEE